MVESRRPVLMTGENPGMTLYQPETNQPLATASYWVCTDSEWGVGHALVVWVAEDLLPTDRVGGIYTDNLPLAKMLVERLTRHFPEFREVPVATLPYDVAQCHHTFDGMNYSVDCRTDKITWHLTWRDPLDRKQILWPAFPAGNARYDLSTVIRPCGDGTIRYNQTSIPGKVQVTQSAEGTISSSAFLAFAETWVGPLSEHV